MHLVKKTFKKKAEWIRENQELKLIIDRLLLDKKNIIKE